MDSLDMNNFNDILNGLSEEEIESYENTAIDSKLVTWAKENCKKNYITLKKQSLVTNLIDTFSEGETLSLYFHCLDYSIDFFRTSLSLFSSLAATPLNDWAKNSTFVLSNKKLYIIHSGQYYDYINNTNIDLDNPKSIVKIILFKNEKESILEFKLINERILYKSYKNDFDALVEALQKNEKMDSLIKVKENAEPKAPLGKKILYIFQFFAALFAISIILFIILALIH